MATRDHTADGGEFTPAPRTLTGNLIHGWLPSWVSVTAPNVAHCDAGSGSHPLHQWRLNGSLFTSRRYTALVRSYGLKQEFITPHCPQQNGMVERVIRTLKG